MTFRLSNISPFIVASEMISQIGCNPMPVLRMRGGRRDGGYELLKPIIIEGQ